MCCSRNVKSVELFRLFKIDGLLDAFVWLKTTHFNQSVDFFNICDTSNSIFKIVLDEID